MATDDLTRFIKANKRSQRILEQSLARLSQLRIGARLSQRARINAKIAAVQQELTQLDIIEEHLAAAKVVIQPMSDADSAQLEELSDKLDDAILHSAAVNATLNTISDIIDTAHQVGSIISSHASS